MIKMKTTEMPKFPDPLKKKTLLRELVLQRNKDTPGGKLSECKSFQNHLKIKDHFN